MSDNLSNRVEELFAIVVAGFDRQEARADRFEARADRQESRADGFDARLDSILREQERLRMDINGWMEKILQTLQLVSDDARVSMWRSEAVAADGDALRKEVEALQHQLVVIRDRLAALEGKAAE